MTRRDEETLSACVGLWVVALLLAGAVATWAARCESQASTDDVQTLLARTVVGECGWSVNNCPAAQLHMLRNRAHNQRRPIAEVALAWSAVWSPSNDGEARPRWVRALPAALPGVELPAPEGWPHRRAKWSRHVRRWREVWRLAGAFMRGQVRNPCNGRPLNAGGRRVDNVTPAPGWRVLDCGETGGQVILGFEGGA